MDNLDNLDFPDVPDYDMENMADLSNDFQIKKLEFLRGALILKEGGSSIHIPVTPFLYQKDVIETELTALNITVPHTIEEIDGKFFHFPVKHNKGYIDGSIYFDHAHNPVDIPTITFGKYNEEDNTLPAVLDCTFLLSTHHDIPDEHYKIKTQLLVTFE